MRRLTSTVFVLACWFGWLAVASAQQQSGQLARSFANCAAAAQSSADSDGMDSPAVSRQMESILKSLATSSSFSASASSSSSSSVSSSMYYRNESTSAHNQVLIGVLTLDKLAKRSRRLATCLSQACKSHATESIFELASLNASWQSVGAEAIVATRVADVLSAVNTVDAVSSSSSPFSKSVLRYFTRLMLESSAHIYDAKIVFLNSEELKSVRGYKSASSSSSSTSNQLKIKANTIIDDFEPLLDNAKRFDWYQKWATSDASSAASNWINYLREQQQQQQASSIDNDESLASASSASSNLSAVLAHTNLVRYVSNVSYDCATATWHRIVSVPFFFPSSGDIRGIVCLTVSLNHADLRQCSRHHQNDDSNDDDDRDRESNANPLYATDKCDRVSTNCVDSQARGFALDSYDCVCKRGFYRMPSTRSQHYNNSATEFHCLKCAEGCEACQDDRPCMTNVSDVLKKATLLINLVCVLMCFALALITWYHLKLKLIQTPSPNMIFFILLGSIVSYCEIIPVYFGPSNINCTLAKICQLEGFLLTYGALILKTWRECNLFYVRSVKNNEQSDNSLVKWLLLIVAIGSAFLLNWALSNELRPKPEVRYDQLGLKYFTCSITEWNFISMAIQLAILIWGVVLSIQVRRASISFKETKLITWAILNECIVICFEITVNVLFHANTTKMPSYVHYIINFIRMHLTITLMLFLLFSYRIYKIVLAKNKRFQVNKSLLLNKCSVNDQRLSTVNEETEKEKELKVEILRLYRQIEEMRTLSMRIANPYFIPKKSRFGNPAKKNKFKNRTFLASEVDQEHEMSSFIQTEAHVLATKPKAPSDKPFVVNEDAEIRHDSIKIRK